MAYRNIVIGVIVVICVLFDVIRRNGKHPLKSDKDNKAEAKKENAAG